MIATRLMQKITMNGEETSSLEKARASSSSDLAWAGPVTVWVLAMILPKLESVNDLKKP